MSVRVSVIIDDEQYAFVRDHSINLSGLVREAVHRYIKIYKEHDIG